MYSPASTCHTLPDFLVAPSLTEVNVLVHDTFKVLSELDSPGARALVVLVLLY